MDTLLNRDRYTHGKVAHGDVEFLWEMLSMDSSFFQDLALEKKNKYFAQVLTKLSDNICVIPLDQLSCPYIKGDELAMSIPEEEYKAGLEGCMINII